MHESIHVFMHVYGYKYMNMYVYQINDFSLEANIYWAGKVECQLGLKPRSLGVQPSAFTIRPPALIASHCSLALT